MDRTQREGLLLVLLSALGYSLFPIFTKNLLAVNVEPLAWAGWQTALLGDSLMTTHISQAGLAPLDLALFRFIIATLLFWGFALRQSVSPGESLPRLQLLLTGVLVFTAAVTAFIGLQFIPASVYVLLFFTYPAMVALISVLLGERLPLIGWVALVLTLIGIGLTLPDFDLTAGLATGDLRGIVLALINALAVALYLVRINRLLRGIKSALRASAWVFTGALIVIIVVSLFREVGVPADLNQWLLLIGLAGFSTVMPYFGINVGVKKLGATRAAIVSTTEPVLTLIWSVLLLSEVLLLPQLFGAALIITSVILLEARPSLRTRSRKLAAPAVMEEMV